MQTRLIAFLVCFCWSLMAMAQDALSTAHNGRWSVRVVCVDAKDAKGYEISFFADIADGKLQGQHGTLGAPGSLQFIGTVQTDGALAIKAAGTTGDVVYNVGKVDKGVPYSYTMKGQLGQTSGEAVRKELRPCTATFAKQR